MSDEMQYKKVLEELLGERGWTWVLGIVENRAQLMELVAESGITYAYDGETEYCCSNPDLGHGRECETGRLLRVVGGVDEVERQANVAWDEALREARNRWCPRRRPITATAANELLRRSYSPDLIDAALWGQSPLVGLEAWLPRTELRADPFAPSGTMLALQPERFYGIDTSVPLPEGRQLQISSLPPDPASRVQMVSTLLDRGAITPQQARNLIDDLLAGPGEGASVDYTSAQGAPTPAAK